ncbi:hypothetical protein KKC59_03960 [bacterium]|nr:hypothetical protein [bacterium]
MKVLSIILIQLFLLVNLGIQDVFAYHQNLAAPSQVKKITEKEQKEAEEIINSQKEKEQIVTSKIEPVTALANKETPKKKIEFKGIRVIAAAILLSGIVVSAVLGIGIGVFTEISMGYLVIIIAIPTLVGGVISLLVYLSPKIRGKISGEKSGETEIQVQGKTQEQEIVKGKIREAWKKMGVLKSVKSRIETVKTGLMKVGFINRIVSKVKGKKIEKKPLVEKRKVETPPASEAVIKGEKRKETSGFKSFISNRKVIIAIGVLAIVFVVIPILIMIFMSGAYFSAGIAGYVGSVFAFIILPIIVAVIDIVIIVALIVGLVYVSPKIERKLKGEEVEKKNEGIKENAPQYPFVSDEEVQIFMFEVGGTIVSVNFPYKDFKLAEMEEFGKDGDIGYVSEFIIKKDGI